MLQSGSIVDFCAHRTTEIIRGNCTVALREITDEEFAKRQTELIEICRGFCLLALELWCQKSNLGVVDDATLFVETFSLNSTLHQPHISMGMDEDDRRFEGVLPHAVLTPAIRIFGNASGDALDQEKIISRSIVLIFEETPLHSTVSSASHTSNIRSQTSEPKSANIGVSDKHPSKKRKLSLQDPPLARQRVASLDTVEFPLTAGSSASMRPHGQIAPANREISLANIVKAVEKGDTYDRVRRSELHAAKQKIQTQSTPVVLSEQSRTSISYHGQGVSDHPHQHRRFSENKKRKVTISKW